MCIASFNFKLYGVETDSIISKQISVLSALQVSLFIKCVKWGIFYPFPNAPESLLTSGELCHQCNSLDKQIYKQQRISDTLELDLSRYKYQQL